MAEDRIPRLDRPAFTVVPLEKADDDLEYWLSRPPEERLSAVEVNRWLVYGYDRATSDLKEFLKLLSSVLWSAAARHRFGSGKKGVVASMAASRLKIEASIKPPPMKAVSCHRTPKRRGAGG